MATVTLPRRRGFGGWYAILLGALLVLLGLVLAVGGGWLISLGGSFYYLPSGVGLIIAGLLLMRQSAWGVWVYVLVYVATLAWAVWEVGLDPWPLVPRVVAPTILLVFVLMAVPAVARRRREGRIATSAAMAVAAVVIAGLALGPVAGEAGGRTDLAQAEPALPSPPPPEEGGSDPPLPQDPPPPEEGRSDPPLPDSLQPLPPEEPEPPAPMPMLETGADWPAYGGTIHATRYSPLAQIDRSNVGRLERVWEYRTGDMPSEESEGKYAAETTPLKIGDDLFLCSAKNILISLDARSGRERWRYDPGVPDDAIPYSASCRGVAYYATPDASPTDHCAARVIEGTLDARLIAVDAATGQPCQDFGVAGEVNLLEGIGQTVPGFFSVTSPPTIVRGVVVIGHQVLDGQRRDAPSGVVRGYDAVTGELRWAWDLGRPGEKGPPPEGETYTRGTPNMWTIASGDEELGLVYLPMGNSAVDYYGATRSEEENRYASSLVAIDVTTGDVAWHFQTVRYDVWDYDLGSQATLVEFPTDQGGVPALLLPSKQGDIYVLDRRTGEPLAPVEERPVPTGGVEPENLSPTQPFSLYHTLAKRDLTERDMWGMSPIDQLWCRIQFRQAAYQGIYTPPTVDQRWIQYPGYNGGSDWGGIAVDQERGIIIANYNDMPNHNRLVHREEVDRLGVRAIDDPLGQAEDAPEDIAPQLGVPYGIDVNAGWRVKFTGLLCKQPPYGGIRAIDVATGRTLWDKPFGTARKNGPFGIPSYLPIDIGTPNNAGAVLTASGLVFIAAATDDLIRAIDIETGEVLWEDALPAGGQATPMTFEVGGRQYLVMMAGGHHFMETPIGDHVIGYALPGTDPSAQ
jgi:quinoprotein glucose dehydrogenase